MAKVKKAAKKPAKKAPAKKKVVAKKAAPKSSPKKSIALSPLSDRIVVRVEGPSERTAGGLYIPATVEDRPHQGQVLACGRGATSKKGHLKPLDVKKGDVVLFSPYAGTETQISGEEVLILREEEVLGVIAQ